MNTVRVIQPVNSYTPIFMVFLCLETLQHHLFLEMAILRSLVIFDLVISAMDSIRSHHEVYL
jgi:hypothetical protein